MKTQDQTTKQTHRSSADTQSGKSGYALAAPQPKASQENVIQLSKVFSFGTKIVPGSTEEKWDVFWDWLHEEYQTPYLYANALSNIILQIKGKNKEEITEFDQAVLDKAEKDLHIEAKYVQYDELNEKESFIVKKIVSGNENISDQQITDEEIDAEGLNTLIEILANYAEQGMKGVDDFDDDRIDLTHEDNDQATILQRSIFDILSEYGIKMAHAAVVTNNPHALDSLNSAKLKHGKTRFNEASKTDIADAAKAAVFWVMSSTEEVSPFVYKLHSLHKASSFGTVLETYANAVIKSEKAKKMLEQLGEIRLKWGPITYDNTIYIQTLKNKLTLPEQWELYQTLVHEALHTAEHPAFTNFLKEYVPTGLHSNIREGTVELLTFKVWGKILDRVEEGSVGAKPATGGSNLVAAKTMLNKMKTDYQKIISLNDKKKKSTYDDQVKLIVNIVDALENGEARLEAAYIYGNLGALLPKDL